LVVTLGLDDKGFKAGAQSARSGLTNISGVAQEAGESIGALALKLGSLAAAFIGIGSLFEYFRNIVDTTGLRLYTMSQNLGIDEKQLLIWGQTAQLAGGQTADAAASINNLQQ